MDYLTLKWLHVLTSTVLFGTGIGSAFYLLFATLSGDVRAIAAVTRYVVLADWLFTSTTAVLQPLTGFWLMHLGKMPLATPWIAWSLWLYAFAIACWLPVVWIQMRLRDLSGAAAAAGAVPPGSCGAGAALGNVARLAGWTAGPGVTEGGASFAVLAKGDAVGAVGARPAALGCAGPPGSTTSMVFSSTGGVGIAAIGCCAGAAAGVMGVSAALADATVSG